MAVIILSGLAGAGLFLGGRMIGDRIRGTAGAGLNEEQREELRGKLDNNPRSIFLYDPVISYRLKPGFRGLRHDSLADPHVTNSRGILGSEEVAPDFATRNLLFLGDSVAYGSHVPFPEIFTSRMGEEAGDDIRFFNAGCPGWSTHQELEFYRLHLSDLPFDRVVIVFCLNDLLRFEWVWRDERSFQMSAELRGLGGLIDSRLTDLRLKNLRAGFRRDPDLEPLAELNNTCLTAYLPGAWDRYQEEVAPALRELAEERKVILAPVPARPQLEAINRGGGPETVLFPQRKLEGLARELGVGYLDLLPAFRSGDGKYDPGLFLPGEKGVLHLSPEGHRRVAEWLRPRLDPETRPRPTG